VKGKQCVRGLSDSRGASPKAGKKGFGSAPFSVAKKAYGCSKV